MSNAVTVHRGNPEAVERADLAIVPRSGLDQAFDMTKYLAGVATPEALARATQLSEAYDHACRALLSPNDFQAAEGGREFKKKSAWRKLGRHFQVSTQVIRQDSGWRKTPAGADYYYAEATVRATAPWGQSMEATAACDTLESRFNGRGADKAKAKAGNDCLATAETRATNRAISNLIAAGEVSAEEVEGGSSGYSDPAGSEGSILDRTIPFGKHKDKTWGAVLKEAPDYVEWAVEKMEKLSQAEKDELTRALNHTDEGGDDEAAEMDRLAEQARMIVRDISAIDAERGKDAEKHVEAVLQKEGVTAAEIRKVGGEALAVLRRLEAKAEQPSQGDVEAVAAASYDDYHAPPLEDGNDGLPF